MDGLVEIMSNDELQKLEKARKILQDISDIQDGLTEIKAISKLNGLYDLKLDCDFAFIKWRDFSKNKCIPSMENKPSHQFSSFVPKMFYDLICAIEKGDLVFKDK